MNFLRRRIQIMLYLLIGRFAIGNILLASVMKMAISEMARLYRNTLCSL